LLVDPGGDGLGEGAWCGEPDDGGIDVGCRWCTARGGIVHAGSVGIVCRRVLRSQPVRFARPISRGARHRVGTAPVGGRWVWLRGCVGGILVDVAELVGELLAGLQGLDGAANDSGATVSGGFCSPRWRRDSWPSAGSRFSSRGTAERDRAAPKLHGHPARRHVESGADAPTNPAHRRHRTQRRAPPAAHHRSGHLPHPHTDRPRTAFDVLNQSSVTVQDTSAPLFPDDQRPQPT
jgi:hypothetical protein